MANMLHRKAVRTLLITAVILQCQILLEVNAYSKVSVGGSGNEEGPKIYKALNLDLIYPKSFNSSDNVISTTPSAQRPPEMGSGPDSADVVAVDDGRQKQQQQQQQYNPWPQSNEQTNRDAGDDDIVDDGGDKQPLYVTPTTPNEAALYRAHNTDVQTNGNAQVVTENPINIQQQQPQRQHHQQQQQLYDNSNNNNAAQQQQQQNIATGRAVDYRTGYPFGQLITPLIKNAPRPAYDSQVKPQTGARRPSTSNVGKIVMYPPQAAYRQKPPSQAEIDKFRGKGYINDRFTPSEAVASHQLKANHNHDHNHNHHNHAPTYTAAGKVPASSNVVNSYVAPKNLYSFPPNNVVYPLPGQDSKLAAPTNVVNSYSPPASGVLKDANYPLATASSNDDGYKYSGPLDLGYLPSINGNGNGDNTKDQGDMGDGNGNDNGGGGGDGNGSESDDGDVNDSIGVLPASAMDGNGSSNNMDSMDSMDTKDEHPHDDHSYDTEKEYPTPPPEWLKSHPEAANEHPPHDHDHHHEEEHHHPDIEFDHDHEHHHHDHEHEHEHEHHHHPDIILDHDHDSYPFHHSFPTFPVYPHYPEIIYDDHHHHEHHEHHVEPPPPPTTEAPPPEPPPEPRVKKYSYFYIGRKLWYIPLYFTVWFSFYVLWLILKSIARHKVNLPNHYVARRSVDDYNLSRKQREIIDQLTVSVMDKIDKFKRQYAT